MGVVVAGGRGESRVGHKIVRRPGGNKAGKMQGREAREARMEGRGAKADERQGQALWEPSKKKQRSSGIGARRGKRARVSDVETIGDNKLVMTSEPGRARHHGRKAEEDIGQKGKQGEASKEHTR